MNKRLLGLLVSGSMVLALNGCGGGSGSGDNGGGQSPQTFSDVNVLDLEQGFIIDGHNNAGESVTLEYCDDNYKYYSGSGYWYGHFNINGDRINMFDDTSTGGSYRIDTLNNLLEVGQYYSIDFQNDEIIVDAITEDLGC